MDSPVNQFIAIVIVVVVIALVITFFLLRKDKEFMLSLAFVECFTGIVAATWFGDAIFRVIARAGDQTWELVKDGGKVDFQPALIGMGVCGGLAFLMMLIRHHYRIRKLAIPPAPPPQGEAGVAGGGN
jgi:hypothetical protein